MVERNRPGPWIIGLLEAYGVERVFGIPGVHTIALYEGLADSRIEHITPRHEQGAGFMADGYARVTGKPGVCFVITGPGLTNILTAMGQAWSESVPMLVISSVSNRRHLGLGLGQLHELPDQQSIAAGVTAFSHTLQSLADLPQVLAQAFAVFHGARPRPVHIEIPLDLWEERAPAELPAVSTAWPRSQPAPALLDDAARRLADARRPVILAGGGALRADDGLRELAERLDAPVVMTVNARGLLPPGHPLGVPASPSADAVRALLDDSDCLLAVGTEIGPTDYDAYERGMPRLAAPLIRLDIDPAQLNRPRAPEVPLLGDAHTTIEALRSRLPDVAANSDGAARAQRTRNDTLASLDDASRRALAFLEQIRDTLPDALIVGDSTLPVYAGNLYFAAARPGSWFNSAMGYGTLGYALPAAMGARLGAPDRPVVCLAGDGGLHYTLGELAAIRAHDQAVIVIAWNNASFAEIRRAMEAEGVTPVGVDLFAPDFVALAQCYGFAAERPTDLAALPEILRQAVERGEPTLIELDEHLVLGEP